MDNVWREVDDYLAEQLLPRDEVLEAVLAANAAAGLPAIDVSPLQGRLLELLVGISGATRVLEIGTLGGYSTIWMARALPPGGSIVTLEHEAAHARVARQNLALAGVADRVDLRVGRASNLLPQLQEVGPFDLIFIDADKPSNKTYLEWSLRLGRPGTVVVLDNVIRTGEVANPASRDASVVGSREGLAFLGEDSRFRVTAVQTVGAKGYDGFALAVVK